MLHATLKSKILQFVEDDLKTTMIVWANLWVKLWLKFYSLWLFRCGKSSRGGRPSSYRDVGNRIAPNSINSSVEGARNAIKGFSLLFSRWCTLSRGGPSSLCNCFGSRRAIYWHNRCEEVARTCPKHFSL